MVTKAGLTNLIEVVTEAGLTNLIEVVTEAGLTVFYNVIRYFHTVLKRKKFFRMVCLSYIFTVQSTNVFIMNRNHENIGTIGRISLPSVLIVSHQAMCRSQ